MQSTQPALNEVATYDEMLIQGYEVLIGRNPKRAIEGYFDAVIKHCDSVYNDTDQKTYSSRGPKEALYYLLKAATDDQAAIVVGQTCAEALYLKGYASLDLGRVEEAKNLIERALEMSPVNSTYLSELGHIYQLQGNWKISLATYRDAEEYAKDFSPEEFKDLDLTRAMRGVGYNLIELGRLDEAKEKYRQCLEIDKDDERALKGIEYIQNLSAEGRDTSKF